MKKKKKLIHLFHKQNKTKKSRDFRIPVYGTREINFKFSVR